MRNKAVFGILFFFALIASTVFGSMVENSRQGSEPIFSIIHQGIELLNPSSDPGFEGTEAENRVRLNNHAKVMTPYLYTSGRFDSFTGNYNLRFRNYNPRHGRFLSSDPIGFAGGANRFGYCRNNPLRWLDPYGLCTYQPDSRGAGPEDYLKLFAGLGGKGLFYGAVIGALAFTGPEAALAAAGGRVVISLTAAEILMGGSRFAGGTVTHLGGTTGGLLGAGEGTFGPNTVGAAQMPNGPSTPQTPFIVNEATIAKALEGSNMQTLQGKVSLPAIERYVRMLEQGKVPPSIKVEGNVIIDGNHRYIAGRIFGTEPPIAEGSMSLSQGTQVRPIQNTIVDPVDWGNY